MRLLSRVMMWGLLFCFPVGATAAEREPSLEVGVGLICNSAQQVERFLSIHVTEKSPQEAIQLVNTEVNDPNACSLAAIAFVRGKESAAVPAPGGVMKVMEITIVAAQTPYGWQRLSGLVQFTAIFEKLDEA
jgi:hypothetical protein